LITTLTCIPCLARQAVESTEMSVADPERREELVRLLLHDSKGQGNFETLAGMQANIFFLLSVKCPSIGVMIGAPVGAMVITRGACSPEQRGVSG
jgi:uncharacterized protein with ATP-grasp and redox domains